MSDNAVLDGVRKCKPERGSPNKRQFVSAVELDMKGHPRRVQFDAMPD